MLRPERRGIVHYFKAQADLIVQAVQTASPERWSMKSKSFVAMLAFLVLVICAYDAFGQSGRKKIRLSLSSTTVALLPTFAAHDKGFFRDEGFDVELVHMPATLASTALMTGELDYNGAVSGVISAAVQNPPSGKESANKPDEAKRYNANKQGYKEPIHIREHFISHLYEGFSILLGELLESRVACWIDSSF
jgi:hypothetical protein